MVDNKTAKRGKKKNQSVYHRMVIIAVPPVKLQKVRIEQPLEPRGVNRVFAFFFLFLLYFDTQSSILLTHAFKLFSLRILLTYMGNT